MTDQKFVSPLFAWRAFAFQVNIVDIFVFSAEQERDRHVRNPIPHPPQTVKTSQECKTFHPPPPKELRKKENYFFHDESS